jgi:predicted metal-dependent hydrolase
MQLGLPFTRPAPAREVVIAVGGHPVTVEFVRHRRARHYIMRVAPDGHLRVTVPWQGSRGEALRFVDERHAWIARERTKRLVSAATRGAWKAGTPVLFHGIEHALIVEPADTKRVRVRLGAESFYAPGERAESLKVPVESWLRKYAAVELPERLAHLARQHGFEVEAVSIRNQRSRWGSCSPSGRISLNWRLVQFPAAIMDYVMIHELVHLHHMNHSRRFWAEVAGLCPGYQSARAWLRAHQRSAHDET